MNNVVEFTIREEENERMYERVELEEFIDSFLYFVI